MMANGNGKMIFTRSYLYSLQHLFEYSKNCIVKWRYSIRIPLFQPVSKFPSLLLNSIMSTTLKTCILSVPQKASKQNFSIRYENRIKLFNNNLNCKVAMFSFLTFLCLTLCFCSCSLVWFIHATSYHTRNGLVIHHTKCTVSLHTDMHCIVYLILF